MTNCVVDLLADVLYSDELNAQRGREYILSRNLDPDKIQFPWLVSSTDTTLFRDISPDLPPITFTECLYVPIVEMDSLPGAPALAGFDIRYIGESMPKRIRWVKQKRDKDSELVYNAQAVLDSEYIIVTEGAIDAETFQLLGYRAMSPLGSKSNPRLVHYLYATGCDIFLAYDNDEKGMRATTKILEIVQKYPNAVPKFRILKYPSKDPNEALKILGKAKLRGQIHSQLPNPSNTF